MFTAAPFRSTDVAIIVAGAPAAPPAVAIGTAKPIADEEALLRRVGQRRDDADDLAGAVQQRAARVAGVHGSVELDEAGERLRRRRSAPCGSSPETTPALSELIEVERVPGRVDVVADPHATAEHRRHDDARAGCRRRARRCRCPPARTTTRCRRLRAVGEGHLDRLGTGRRRACAVRIWPLSSITTPAPDMPLVRRRALGRGADVHHRRLDRAEDDLALRRHVLRRRRAGRRPRS